MIAGFVHENQEIAVQRLVRDEIEGLVGRQVDVASACGLGRRSVEAATANLKQSRVLAAE